MHRRTEKTENKEKHYNCVQLCTWCVPLLSLNYFYSSRESWLSKENNSTSHEMQLLLQNLTREIYEKGWSLHDSNSVEDKERNPFAEKAVFTTLAAKSFLSYPLSNCCTLSTPSEAPAASLAQTVQTMVDVHFTPSCLLPGIIYFASGWI